MSEELAEIIAEEDGGASMKFYQVTTSAIATERYVIAAETPEAAKQSFADGKWESYNDLGNDDVEVIDVEEIA